MKFFHFGKRKNPRKVCGFLCDKTLWIVTWALTQQLNIPHYCTVEHALQIGIAAIAKALADEKTKLKLIDHLTQEHLLKPRLDPENPYDKEVLEKAKTLEIQRQEVEIYTKELLDICDTEDLHPLFLLVVAQSWLKELRDRRQRVGDIPHRHEFYQP